MSISLHPSSTPFGFLLGSVSTYIDIMSLSNRLSGNQNKPLVLTREGKKRACRKPWGSGHIDSHDVHRYLISTFSLPIPPHHLGDGASLD